MSQRVHLGGPAGTVWLYKLIPFEKYVYLY
jgi:hypothetical protein